MIGFIGEIRMFPYGRVPRGWLHCDGRRLAIDRQHATLFHVIEFTYGGDGQNSFDLPDLRGRLPVGAGQRPGGAHRQRGDKGGQAAVKLELDQLPVHGHPLRAANGSPASRPAIKAGAGAFAPSGGAPTARVFEPVGGGEAHENLPPYLDLQYCICYEGYFPTEGEA